MYRGGVPLQNHFTQRFNFGPPYFHVPLLLRHKKGTYNFGIVRDIIYIFKKLRRNIESGMENTADELMSDIRFWTTHKGDMPQ